MHLKVAWNSILAPKSLFTYDVTLSCLKAWYTLLTTKNWFFGKGNYFICITVIFQLIATDNFHFGTPLKCRRHSKYFHLCAYFGIQLTITFFSNDRFSLNFQYIIYFEVSKHYIRLLWRLARTCCGREIGLFCSKWILSVEFNSHLYQS